MNGLDYMHFEPVDYQVENDETHIKYKITGFSVPHGKEKFIFATIDSNGNVKNVMDQNKQQKWRQTVAHLKKSDNISEVLESIEDVELRRNVIDVHNPSLTDLFYKAAKEVLKEPKKTQWQKDAVTGQFSEIFTELG